MTNPAQPPTSTAPAWRTPAIIGGVVAIAVVAGLIFANLNAGQPAASGSPEPTPSQSPSVPASPSAPPSEAPATPSAEPTPVAAPDDWTQVHTIGDGSERIVGGEIAWGDAGFLAVGKRFEPAGDVGIAPAGFSFWLSADGQRWAEVRPPVTGEEGYDVAALTGAADGSYVFHAFHFVAGAPSSAVVSFRSTDGETWEELETGLRDDLPIQAIETGPSGYLLVAGQGVETGATLWLSSDGLTYELVHEFEHGERYVQIHDGDGGADGYVVIGRRGVVGEGEYERFAFASADGREWVERAAPFGPDDQTFVWDVAVSSHGGDWLATLGNREDVVTVFESSDGLNWSEAGTFQTPERNLAAPGLFEEVGAELILSPGATTTWEGTPGTFASTDGATWSPVDLGVDAYTGELAIGDGVVAMTGTIPGTGDDVGSTAVIWIKATD